MKDINSYKDIPSFNKLIEDLNHPNPNINHKACIHMLTSWHKESKDYLIYNLSNPDIVLRRKSVNALSYFGIEVISPIVNLFINNKSSIIKVSCLKVLVKVFSKNEIKRLPNRFQELIQIGLESEDPAIILTLISLLRELKFKGLPYLFKLCKDKDVLKAKAAIISIIEIQDSSIREFLIELLKDNSIDEFILVSIKEALSHLDNKWI